MDRGMPQKIDDTHHIMFGLHLHHKSIILVIS